MKIYFGQSAKLALGLLAVMLGLAVSFALWRPTSPKQTADCVRKRTCLPSYNNTGVCEALKIGTEEGELIYRLGQPIKQEGNTLYFEPGATEPGPIEVKLDKRGNAVELICRPIPLA